MKRAGTKRLEIHDEYAGMFLMHTLRKSAKVLRGQQQLCIQVSDQLHVGGIGLTPVELDLQE